MRITHRSIIILILFAATDFCLTAQHSSTVPLFVGTYTGEGSEGIYRCLFDTVKGTLSEPALTAKVANPSYIAIASNRRTVWSVSELDQKFIISAFAVTDSAGLRPLNQVEGIGGLGCYISETEPSKSIAVACYGSGLVASFKLNADGSVAAPVSIDQHWGRVTHAHSILPDLWDKYIYSADLGIDKVLVYKIQDGKLSPYDEVCLPQGSGPRHLAFHPSGKWMAVASELKSTVSVLAKDTDGVFRRLKVTVSMLPATFKGKSAAADIHFSADGKFLYASNRGHNSIAIYKFDNDRGTVIPVGWAIKGINRPRNFIIAPGGKFLLVANQDGNDIVVFGRDTKTGLLKPLDRKVSVSHPVCLQFLH
jgi:6-phosphogluconolactonase